MPERVEWQVREQRWLVAGGPHEDVSWQIGTGDPTNNAKWQTFTTLYDREAAEQIVLEHNGWPAFGELIAALDAVTEAPGAAITQTLWLWATGPALDLMPFEAAPEHPAAQRLYAALCAASAASF